MAKGKLQNYSKGRRKTGAAAVDPVSTKPSAPQPARGLKRKAVQMSSIDRPPPGRDPVPAGGPPVRARRAVLGDVGEAQPAAGEASASRRRPDWRERARRRKEMTRLYQELIQTKRDRPAERIVGDIIAVLRARPRSLAEQCSTPVCSRVMQACLKSGSVDQRRLLLAELKNDIPTMCCNQYAHVVVLKLLRYITQISKQRTPSDAERKTRAENLKDFLSSFENPSTVHRIFYHSYGCRVISAIYFDEHVSAKLKQRVLRDLAVPAATRLTRPDLVENRSVQQLLGDEQLSSECRRGILECLQEATVKIIDKELLRYDIVHLLFHAFCQHCSEEQLRELTERAFPGAAYLLSSKAGACSVVSMLGVATPKQKKVLMKDLKGKFSALAMNEVDYIVMMRLLSTVDDTVLLAKALIAEWIPHVEELMLDKYGWRVLCWGLCPGSPHFSSPLERDSVLKPAPSSLKDASVREKEVFGALGPAVREALLSKPLEAAAHLHGKQVLLGYLSAKWDAEVLEALLKTSETELQADRGDLFCSGTAVTTFLTLLKLEPEDRRGCFAVPLFERCMLSRLAELAVTRHAFLLLGMLKVPEVRLVILNPLKKKCSEIRLGLGEAEARGELASGARQLLAALGDSPRL